MDAETLKSLLPEFSRFIGRFADCFGDHRCREHLPVYIRGQLSNLDRKSVKPIAVASGVATRTLQEFLVCCIGTMLQSRDVRWRCPNPFT